jgi:hypothetical protein
MHTVQISLVWMQGYAASFKFHGLMGPGMPGMSPCHDPKSRWQNLIPPHPGRFFFLEPLPCASGSRAPCSTLCI